ncbi:MAG: magnesium transporter [Verrucomicrobiia bacterium]
MNNEQINIEELGSLHPSEIAQKLKEKRLEEISAVLEKLSEEKAAATLIEMTDLMSGVLERISDEKLVKIMSKVSPETSADLLGCLSKTRKSALISRLPTGIAEQIVALLKYSPNTAGGIMSGRFVKLNLNETIGESVNRIRSKKEWTPGDIGYLYVTDDSGRLVGIAQVHDVLFGDPNTPIKDIVKRDVKYLRTDSTIEEIEYMFSHYRYLGLPVVDELGRIVGIVKSGDVVNIVEREATRDMQLMVGLSGIERIRTPWKISIKQRLPWLYFNLATSFVAAIALGLFENTLGRWIALAVFLPVILSQGANAGLQTLTIIVRELALGEMLKGDDVKALRKELLIGILCGVATGIVVGVAGYFWKGTVMIGIVAGSAIVLTQIVAGMSGVLIPILLKALKIDPALAASILLTTITDVAGIIIFFGIATIVAKITGII